MPNPPRSTIAQILFDATSALNFARIVAELEQVLMRLKGDRLTTTWDCDNLVFFDLAETRIGLGFSSYRDGDVANSLSVSVGPRPGLAQPKTDAGYDVLASRIVERIQSRHTPSGIFWHQTSQPITAELIDSLIDRLPAQDKILPPIEGVVGALWEAAALAEVQTNTQRVIGRFPEPPQREPVSTVTSITEPVLADEDNPVRLAMPVRPRSQPKSQRLARLSPDDTLEQLPPAAEPELDRLRDVLQAEAVTPTEAPSQLSTQMRLAVHAMNATLIMVWLPLGAAAMTYSILKGEDMRLSARLMALTGTFLAVARSPLGHRLAAAVAGTHS